MAVRSIPRNKSTQSYAAEDAAHDRGYTEKELRHLLYYLDRCAWTFYNACESAIPYHEFQDGGVDGLLHAWQTWQKHYRIPFHAHAKATIAWRMRNRIRDYRAWSQPTRSASFDPPAEHVRPVTSRESEALHLNVCWLAHALATHRACLSPVTQVTLDDYLAERPYPEICRRDGITTEGAKRRRHELLTTLRRHLGPQATSCAYEQARWREVNNYTARLLEGSDAAAD